jgi:signal transduction histidine kinase/ligand-binding sensor domain-containing protein
MYISSIFNRNKSIKPALASTWSVIYILLFLNFIVGLNPAAFAQIPEKLRFEHFTIQQGLSNNWIRDITQDHLGYIWVATQSGVNRYDGYDFKVYRNIPSDFSTITDNSVNTVYADSYGKLWIGTISGLNLYNAVGDRFERIYHEAGNDSSLPGNVIHVLFESKNGDLWIGTNNGLSLYDRENHAFINNWQVNGKSRDIKGVEIVSITEDTDGILWIGSSDNGLITFNPKNQSIRYFDEEPISGVTFPSSNISKVMADSFGNIWIGFLTTDIQGLSSETVKKSSSLARLNFKTYEYTQYNVDDQSQHRLWVNVSDILQSLDGSIWITTYSQNDFGGLLRFDWLTEKFTPFYYDAFDPSSLLWMYATAVFLDRFNNLWVGSSRGISKADLGKWQMNIFRFMPEDPSFYMDNFYGIEEVEEGVFWLGLDGPGLIEWNKKSGEKTHFSPIKPFSKTSNMDISAGSPFIIKKDHSGEIWLGYAGQGLARTNLHSKEIVRYFSNSNRPGALSGNYVTGILVDETNTVWVATTDGLNRYNRADDSFTTWTIQNSNIGSNSLSTIFKDSRGIIWLGTKEHVYGPKSTRPDGLIKFDPVSEKFTLYKHNSKNPNSLSSNAINAIDEDKFGRLWIATNNGLNRFNLIEETFKHYHVADGLPDAVVIGLLFDNEGMLWLSTLNGLSCFNPAASTFRNYGMSDGVQAFRFNSYSYFKSKEGELIFGGVAGANFFNPSEIFENSTEPVVYLTNFMVNNKPFTLRETLQKIGLTELSWRENSIGFEFTAINFRSPELTKYEYKLEGYDDEWISSGTRRFANYTNLPSGNYTFQVRAINGEGITSPVNATLAIRIHPPIWKSWWAYGFYAILFFFGLFTFDRVQRKRIIQKQREEIREKELQQAKEIEKAYQNLEVAHESLKSTQTQLIQQEKLASLGQLTAGIAHEIKNPLNFVNNFSDVSIEMIDEAIDEVKAQGLVSPGQEPTGLEPQAVQTITNILNDVRVNLTKIHEHGSRADGIVKSMLLHSRGGSGKMEPTDLNALIREYVNLSYHGMRASKNPINIDIQFDLDESIGKVDLIGEDFSRVILNLCSNAFDAMRTVKTQRLASLYVRTKKINNSIVIEVEDNGPGITDDIKDKILQPFFTTKKGTEGTGLGLSITHDIIKAHGGQINIESNENEGSKFSILLDV